MIVDCVDGTDEAECCKSHLCHHVPRYIHISPTWSLQKIYRYIYSLAKNYKWDFPAGSRANDERFESTRRSIFLFFLLILLHFHHIPPHTRGRLIFYDPAQWMRGCMEWGVAKCTTKRIYQSLMRNFDILIFSSYYWRLFYFNDYGYMHTYV
jgi:hypothetical protein